MDTDSKPVDRPSQETVEVRQGTRPTRDRLRAFHFNRDGGGRWHRLGGLLRSLALSGSFLVFYTAKTVGSNGPTARYAIK